MQKCFVIRLEILVGDYGFVSYGNHIILMKLPSGNFPNVVNTVYNSMLRGCIKYINFI